MCGQDILNYYVSPLQNLWSLFNLSQRGLDKLASLFRGNRGQTRWVQAAILFTDIVGFSVALVHLSRCQQQQVLESLTGEYYDLLHQCVRYCRGNVDKFMGDGMMAVFLNPRNAVSAAWLIQERVARFNLQQDQHGCPPFPTRTVIDSGPVLFVRQSRWEEGVGPGTYLGEAVNRAAHLARLVPPGRVLVSQYMLDQLVALADFVAQPERCDPCLDVYEMKW